MSRVKILQNSEMPPESRQLITKIEDRGARVLNLYRILAHNPDILRDCLKLGTTLLKKTSLSAKLRELAILRIATITGSEYEWAQHYPIALQTGVTESQAQSLDDWRKATCFDTAECAVLQYADEVAQQVKVKDETFASLKQHLGQQEIVELTLAIGFWGLIARVLVPLEVEIDQATASSLSDLTG
jgi:4-carboxymuconolactone decarboxylase